MRADFLMRNRIFAWSKSISSQTAFSLENKGIQWRNQATTLWGVPAGHPEKDTALFMQYSNYEEASDKHKMRKL